MRLSCEKKDKIRDNRRRLFNRKIRTISDYLDSNKNIHRWVVNLLLGTNFSIVFSRCEFQFNVIHYRYSS